MTLKIGIIGCGAITERAYLPGFASPGTEESRKGNSYFYFGGCEKSDVIALADIDIEKAEELAEEFNVENVYKDWKELIANDEIDAVCVNTPNVLHAEMTIAAAKAGKHVMVEKPMTDSMENANSMIKAASENNVFLMVDQTQRFWPIHETATKIVNSGIIGNIISVRGKTAHSGPEFWSPGSEWFFKKNKALYGAMFDIGIHKLDLIRYMTGLEITEVAGFTDTLCKDIEVEDNAVAIFRFENGGMGILEASWTCNPRENTTYVYGTKGTMRIGVVPESPIHVEFSRPKQALFRDIPVGEIKNGVYVPQLPDRTTFDGPWKHFVDSILTGRQPSPSGVDGKKSIEVILAIYKSSESGKVIKLSL